TDFTRARALPLPTLVALLVNLRNGTIQDELDQFIDLFSEGLTVHGVTASAFGQARQKLNPRACRPALPGAPPSLPRQLRQRPIQR
ncbi:MAG TPA: hypothetical protein VES73_05190, partial [Lamprocystis sp. (in: g-proteobacteria)]|nr:hypothetical protein [Lamprocystis sp. (in: g-proteobacteria)]